MACNTIMLANYMLLIVGKKIIMVNIDHIKENTQNCIYIAAIS